MLVECNPPWGAPLIDPSEAYWQSTEIQKRSPVELNCINFFGQNAFAIKNKVTLNSFGRFNWLRGYILTNLKLSVRT